MSLSSKDKPITKFIEAAIEQALRSDMGFKHGAVIVKDGLIVSRGFNYIYKDRRSKNHYSMHAERSAIYKALHCKVDLDGASIYVVRLNNLGNLSHSKPCYHCAQKIIELNITRTYYSISQSQICETETRIIDLGNVDKFCTITFGEYKKSGNR